MASKQKLHLVEELENQFHVLHQKIVKSKDNYLAAHQKDFDKAARSVKVAQSKLGKAKQQVIKYTLAAKKSGSVKAHNELKKARAAAALLADSLHEAKTIMATSQSKLKVAKPFQKKLAARARALEAFEKDWEQKQKAEALAAAKRATAARKKRAAARKKQPT